MPGKKKPRTPRLNKRLIAKHTVALEQAPGADELAKFEQANQELGRGLQALSDSQKRLFSVLEAALDPHKVFMSEAIMSMQLQQVSDEWKQGGLHVQEFSKLLSSHVTFLYNTIVEQRELINMLVTDEQKDIAGTMLEDVNMSELEALTLGVKLADNNPEAGL